MAFRERDAVTVVIDLARFTHAVAGMDALGIAELLEKVNAELAAVIAARGGRVVKFLGDGCLAVFPAEASAAAVNAVKEIGTRVRQLGDELRVDLDVGANVHLSKVADGDFEPAGFYDVIGAGVMHTFRMGAGAGVRISEPVYRQLPSDERSGWSKNRPPVTYTLVTR